MKETDFQPITMPFPTSHMKWMNCYCLPGEDGWTLIDAGPNTDAARAVWIESLQQRGIGFGDVSQIVLTHHHSDHLGLAHWLQEQTGAPIRMSEMSYNVFITPHDLDLFEGLLRDHQFSDEQREGIMGYVRLRNSWKKGFDQIEFLTPGSRVRLGQDWFDIVQVGGHAAGHLCFHQPEQQRIICADSVMPKFIPNINYTPEFEPNPVLSYFEGLQALAQLPVKTAYPGHGVPFDDFHTRIQESQAIVEGKIQKFLADLKTHPTLSRIYEKKGGRRFAPAQGFFMFTELVAYVRYLQSLGVISETVQDGQISFVVEEGVGR